MDVRGGNLAGSLRVDGNLLGSVAVHLCCQALEVQDQFSDVLLHARYSRELMLHTLDVHRRDRHAREGGQQHPAQGVAQGVAEAALQGFHNKLAVAVVLANFHALDACLFDFDDHFVYPPLMVQA